MRFLLAFLAAALLVLLLLWVAAMFIQPPEPVPDTRTDTVVPFSD